VLRVPAAELGRIGVHGAETFPEEACGFLLGRATEDGTSKEVVTARPAQNEKEDERHRRYLISPLEVMRADEEAARRGLDLIGFYHSHPTGIARPSDFDRQHAWPWYSYVIVAVTYGKPGEVASWVLAPDRAAFSREDILQVP
jgi:proteasome lid subunit RPN8/RPN11